MVKDKRLKANIQYYEFTCGCRVKKEQLKRRKIQTEKNAVYACKEHRKPVKHICLLCPDCGELFFDTGKPAVRCPGCVDKRRAERQAIYAKKQEDKKKKLGRNDAPPKPKPKLKAADIFSGATCVFRSECLEKFFKDGTVFKCVGCQRFEAINIDDYIDTGKDGASTYRNRTLDRF
jgi:hypothetical protein